MGRLAKRKPRRIAGGRRSRSKIATVRRSWPQGLTAAGLRSAHPRTRRPVRRHSPALTQRCELRTPRRWTEGALSLKISVRGRLQRTAGDIAPQLPPGTARVLCDTGRSLALASRLGLPTAPRGAQFSRAGEFDARAQPPSRPGRLSTSSRRSRSSFRALSSRSMPACPTQRIGGTHGYLEVRPRSGVRSPCDAVERAHPHPAVQFHPDQPVLHRDRHATFIRVSKGVAIIRYRGESHAVAVPLAALSVPPAKQR